jgi:thiamine pyrophosphokinase
MATDTVTIWHPADIFSATPETHKGFALLILNQPLEIRGLLYHKIGGNAVYRVAADGGANRVHDMNISNKGFPNSLDLDTIIGDLDSLRPDVREFWCEKGSEIIHDPDQYSTDFTKGVKYIKSFEVPEGAEFTPSNIERREAKGRGLKESLYNKDIVCIGGLGGRVDQGMSTMHHLYTFQKDPGYTSGRMFLLSTESITFVLQSGKHKIKVREKFADIGLGKHIGIIPLKEPSVITTSGLEWDVTDWRTEFGGQISTSNHVREDWATVETTKDVLFTIDLEFPSSPEQLKN